MMAIQISMWYRLLAVIPSGLLIIPAKTGFWVGHRMARKFYSIPIRIVRSIADVSLLFQLKAVFQKHCLFLWVFNAGYSPDSKFLAYTPVEPLWQKQTWKRYRGGQMGKIWILDLQSLNYTEIPRQKRQ